MPDILLFGATGYTGRLTAHALARRNASFAVAGRDATKLEALGEEVGAADARVARAGDIDSLTRALEDVRVLLTCVGPFVQLGETAIEAALRAQVNYVDSTGEGPFIERLIGEYDERARAAGVVVAPALAFDEVPIDVAATLACEGLTRPDLWLTYATGATGSSGTLRSAFGIATSDGPCIENGRRRRMGAGAEERWAPMPPPLGPRRAATLPLAEAHLAPLHLELDSLKTYVTTGATTRAAMRFALPALRVARRLPLTDVVLERLLPSGKGPNEQQRARSRFTLLAEARSGNDWRNVALQGNDVYGLSAELLAAGALRLAKDDDEVRRGVVAPVEVGGLEFWQSELSDRGVSIRTFQPA